jgi:hypothetical protein
VKKLEVAGVTTLAALAEHDGRIGRITSRWLGARFKR